MSPAPTGPASPASGPSGPATNGNGRGMKSGSGGGLPASMIERFSAGERFAVDPDAIERELSSLWRAAGSSTETNTPVTRACLWNVVLHLEERDQWEGHGTVERLEKMVRDLPRYLAARALVLRTQPEQPGLEELESWISANCIVAEGGGKLVCSEEVQLAARGRGERHLPSLVRALLVPQLPSALVFGAVPPSDDAPIRALIETADRIVTHADHCTHPSPLARVADVMARVPLGVMDLGWLELAPLRRLVANLFDPPTTDEAIAALDHVVVTASPRHRSSARLVLAWIAGVLDGSAPRAIGQGAWRFQRAGKKALEVVLQDDPSAATPSVELSASSTGAVYAVRAAGETMADVVGPDIASKKSLGRPNFTQLLARALATRAEDRAFARALTIAGGLP